MIYFIVNPAAGCGKALASVPIIKETMERMHRPYKLLETAQACGGAELARLAAADGAKAVVAVGGDGTLQEVAEGLVNSGVPLGILPSGSGNDFIQTINKKYMDKPPPKPFEEAAVYYLNRILRGEPSYIDVIKLRESYFLNIGSIGIDAEIVVDAAKLKKIFGKAAYLVSTIRNSFTYAPRAMRVVFDGTDYSGEPTLAAMCNGRYYGGGFNIAPPAEIDDGRITVCLIDKLSKLKILALFPSVLFGKHVLLKEVKFINCKKVSIFYEGVRNVNLDGNIYTLEGPLDFEIIEKGIGIL